MGRVGHMDYVGRMSNMVAWISGWVNELTHKCYIVQIKITRVYGLCFHHEFRVVFGLNIFWHDSYLTRLTIDPSIRIYTRIYEVPHPTSIPELGLGAWMNVPSRLIRDVKTNIINALTNFNKHSIDFSRNITFSFDIKQINNFIVRTIGENKDRSSLPSPQNIT